MLKKILYWFSVFLLSLVLVLTLVIVPISTHLTNRQSVKNWVSNPELLDGAVNLLPALLAQGDDSGAGQENLSQILEQNSINEDEIIDALKTVITVEWLAEKFGIVIDGTYDWLEGKTPEPEFEVVFTDKLTAVATAITNPLKSELAKLPACPTNVTIEDFNPFKEACVPLGVDIAALVDEYTSQLTSTSDIADISISSDEIDFDEEMLTTAPSVFSAFETMPYVLLALLLLLSAAVVLLASSVKKGIRKLSWVFIINGAISALSFWILGKTSLLARSYEGSDIDPAVIENIIEPLASQVLGDVSSTGVILGLLVVSVGVLLWLSNFIHHKVSHEEQAQNKPDDEIKNPAPTQKQKSS